MFDKSTKLAKLEQYIDKELRDKRMLEDAKDMIFVIKDAERMAREAEVEKINAEKGRDKAIADKAEAEKAADAEKKKAKDIEAKALAKAADIEAHARVKADNIVAKANAQKDEADAYVSKVKEKDKDREDAAKLRVAELEKKIAGLEAVIATLGDKIKTSLDA
jgi:hypothetical protein